MRMLLLAMIILLSYAPSGAARQMALVPESSLRLVNPENDDEVRVLYRFSFPEVLRGSTIVDARICFEGLESDDVPLALVPLIAPWTRETTWNRFNSIRGNATDEREIESVHDGKSETDLSSLVRAWCEGSTTNHGFFITGRRLDVAPSSRVLVANMTTPKLSIIYTRRVEESE